ncbi:MAG TPA: DPP IV N-terminal domain-containing protein [Candidatus Binataceae bacterium]|nr:DPP IV N-terminal domain-containing protein [Candidatus Binataceae bacterium]
MKRFIFQIAILFLSAIALTARSATAEPIKIMIVGPGSELSPIAISELKNLDGDDDHRLSAEFDGTLQRNLELSGYFRLIKPQAYIEDPQKSGYELGQFNFSDWHTINASFLVKGAVSRKGDTVKLTAFLYDVAQQRRMMGKNYTGGEEDVRTMARRFADSILEATTGQLGPFDSKLAFVSTRGGRFKEVYWQTLDGETLFRVTDNPTINLFPGFDRTTNHLLYLSYKSMEPALYLADLQSEREIQIKNPNGKVIGGAISADASRVVAAVERDGATNLYLMTGTGAQIRQLTDTAGINVSPAISQDGSTLAFTSDRSGTPQIYTMPLEGGQAHRVTYSGDYNTTPAFSPKGDRIAYQSRANSRFDIWSIPVAGGEPEQLTEGAGSNEHPSWSPDGRYIAFSSTREGRPRAYIMMVSNRKVISPLTEGKGDDSCPAWSWWLGD